MHLALAIRVDSDLAGVAAGELASINATEPAGSSTSPITRRILSSDKVPCSEIVFFPTAAFQSAISSSITPALPSVLSKSGLANSAAGAGSPCKSTTSIALHLVLILIPRRTPRTPANSDANLSISAVRSLSTSFLRNRSARNFCGNASVKSIATIMSVPAVSP